jgi:hypothetical protein
MNPMLRAVILSLLFLIAGITQAHAIDIDNLADQSTYRCGGGIVATGDSDSLVREKCGQPAMITRQESDSYDIWIYYFGGSRFMYYFGFLHGNLQRIVSAPCTSSDPDCFDLR